MKLREARAILDTGKGIRMIDAPDWYDVVEIVKCTDNTFLLIEVWREKDIKFDFTNYPYLDAINYKAEYSFKDEEWEECEPFSLDLRDINTLHALQDIYRLLSQYKGLWQMLRGNMRKLAG